MAYRFLLGTGLRRTKVRQLVWGDLHLECVSPYRTLRAQTTKSKRADSLPLPNDLAKCLQDARGDVADADRVFPPHLPSMERHRAILVAAQVDYRDDTGRLADFHALRHTFGTMLSASGVARAKGKVMNHTRPPGRTPVLQGVLKGWQKWAR